MKKLLLAAMMALAVVPASAQFEKGKVYVNTNFTGLNLAYSGNEKFTFGLGAMGGYFFADSWMVYGTLGYNHQGSQKRDDVTVGAGCRYYFIQNGLYLNLGAQYQHVSPNINNVQICPEVGYTFFLNQHVTIEPSVYYNMSLNDFSNGSKVGLRIAFGYFFNTKK